MFTIILTLHIIGACLSAGVVLYGLQAAVRKKGNLHKLVTASMSLSVYEIATGVILILLKPSVSAVTTFCVFGTGIIAAFLAVNTLAAHRITQSPAV
jgi:hypothetical protein